MKLRSLRLAFGIPFGGTSQVREIFAGNGVEIEYHPDQGRYRIASGKDVKWLEKHIVEWGVEDAVEIREVKEDDKQKHRDRDKGRKA